MDGELVSTDLLLGTGFFDQLFSQSLRFEGGDHPADDVTAEDVHDHVEVEIGPLGRA